LWQLLELPSQLKFTRTPSGHYGFDSINAGSETVVSHMRRCHRVTGGARRRNRCLVFHSTRRGMRGNRGLLRGADGNLASGPRSGFLDRLVRSTIGALVLKQR